MAVQAFNDLSCTSRTAWRTFASDLTRAPEWISGQYVTMNGDNLYMGMSNEITAYMDPMGIQFFNILIVIKIFSI